MKGKQTKMRGIGNHNPPFITQDYPEGNTSGYVNTQVKYYFETGIVVNVESAREIASWFQASNGRGYGFAVFASTGTINAEFPTVIRHELHHWLYPNEEDSETLDNLRALLALQAYVNKCLEDNQD